MTYRNPSTVLATHQVTNQPPEIGDYNPYLSDPTLRDAVGREGGGWAEDRLTALGAEIGSERVRALGHTANRQIPELRTHDRFGHRIDEVDFHPAYHQLMALAISHGAHSIPWTDNRDGGHVAHAAMQYLLTQAEAGICCPIAMAYAAIPTLRQHVGLAADWEPRLLANAYDPSCIPAAEKSGVTIGMAMTEKQGGSDVRANTTRAVLSDPKSDEYALTGHKWFCSAPMSDAFMTLAQTEAGPTCFFLPRWRPDGTRNGFHIQRLKDKLGNRSNASAEIEYRDAYAIRIGAEGQGVRTIIDMVQLTRLDATAAPAGMMRQAVVMAVHHATHRKAFGKRLVKQPLMQNVLADMVVESEAATLLAMRIAGAVDQSDKDQSAQLFARIAVPVAKFWINKQLPNFVYEAMECHGGAGYVEESYLPRLYREAPLNSIWEGSGNVICLDVLRTLHRSPDTAEAFLTELNCVKGVSPDLDAVIETVKNSLARSRIEEADARIVTESMALALQASLVVRHAPTAVADTYCASRLSDKRLRTYGTLSDCANVNDIIARAAIGQN